MPTIKGYTRNRPKQPPLMAAHMSASLPILTDHPSQRGASCCYYYKRGPSGCCYYYKRGATGRCYSHKRGAGCRFYKHGSRSN